MVKYGQAAPENIAKSKTDVITAKLIARIEVAAQAVLDARAAHQTGLPTGTAPSTLAQLYDPTTMPVNLAKAHAALDKTVDAAYKEDGGATSYANDGERGFFVQALCSADESGLTVATRVAKRPVQGLKPSRCHPASNADRSHSIVGWPPAPNPP